MNSSQRALGDAEEIYGFLHAASTASAYFHAVSEAELLLTTESVRSSFYSQLGGKLEQLKLSGMDWITGVWPDATIVPQAFINISNRLGATVAPVERALARGDGAEAARLLRGLAARIDQERAVVASYRDTLAQSWYPALALIEQLTSGSQSIAAVIAADNQKVAALQQEIADLRVKIQNKIQEMLDKIAFEKKRLEVSLFMFKFVREVPKIVGEWAKHFITTLSLMTGTIFDPREYVEYEVSIIEKTAQIDQLGRDAVTLGNLAGTLDAIGKLKTQLSLDKIERIFTAQSTRIATIAAALGSAEAIAAARRQVGEEAAAARELAAHCTRLQESAVAAQQPPTLLWVS